ncbi:hypothetical protein D9M73_234330 [compost metagenome]
MDDIEQGYRRSEVDAPIPLGRKRPAIARFDLRQRLHHTERGRGDDVIEHRAAAAQIATDQGGGALAARVEGAVVITERRIVPPRFGVAEQRQRLGAGGHAGLRQAVSRASCPVCAAEGSAAARATASSSVTRVIVTPGGKAVSSRDGIAAESKMNTP